MSNSLQPYGLYSPWNSPGQNTGVGNLSLLQGIFPTQESNPGFPHCRQILYQLSHKGSPRVLEWVAYPFSSRSSRPRDWTQVSRIAGRFFTSWATREAQEYWNGLPCPPPEDLPDPGIKPTSPALAGGFFTIETPGKPSYLATPRYISMCWTYFCFFISLMRLWVHRTFLILSSDIYWNPVKTCYWNDSSIKFFWIHKKVVRRDETGRFYTFTKREPCPNSKKSSSKKSWAEPIKLEP